MPRNIYHHEDLIKCSKGDQAGSRVRAQDLGEERLRPWTGGPSTRNAPQV